MVGVCYYATRYLIFNFVINMSDNGFDDILIYFLHFFNGLEPLQQLIILQHSISSSYNYLNLPQQINISTDGNNEINYLYTANGQKLMKQTRIDNAVEQTVDYIGNFVYENNVLKYILTGEGRVLVNSGPSYEYHYFLKDHLGNTRITFNQNGQIIQEDAFYPFGMKMNGLCYETGEDYKNKYLYNGKELQDDFGLDWYDYGARFYDPESGRWWSMDPLVEQYRRWSPYNYCLDNPIRFIDPDGNEIVDATGKPISYDAKNGWSKNATNDVKVIYSALVETKTGTEQWNTAYNSESKIEMNIVEEKLYSEKSPGKLALGQTDQALGFNLENASYLKTDNVMKIDISIGSINESFDGKNKGLTLRQAIGATAGHEIEHTKEENRDIGVQQMKTPFMEYDNKGRARIEINPNKIGAKIRQESQNSLKKLAPIMPKQLDARDLDSSRGVY
jgi:RHS repeat-associated protein